jgi:hypothetical protein
LSFGQLAGKTVETCIREWGKKSLLLGFIFTKLRNPNNTNDTDAKTGWLTINWLLKLSLRHEENCCLMAFPRIKIDEYLDRDFKDDIDSTPERCLNTASGLQIICRWIQSVVSLEVQASLENETDNSIKGNFTVPSQGCWFSFCHSQSKSAIAPSDRHSAATNSAIKAELFELSTIGEDAWDSSDSEGSSSIVGEQKHMLWKRFRGCVLACVVPIKNCILLSISCKSGALRDFCEIKWLQKVFLEN